MLTLDIRRKYRDTLRNLSMRIEAITKTIYGTAKLSAQQHTAFFNITGTENSAGQLEYFKAAYCELDALYDEKLLAEAKSSYSVFCEYMFRHEPPSAHHELMIAKMEAMHHGDIEQLMMSAPIGSGKTTYTSIRFAAWHLGRKPDDRLMQAGMNTHFIRERVAKPTANLMDSHKFRQVFPDITISPIEGSHSTAFTLVGHRGCYQSFGTGVGLGGYRFDMGNFDDPFGSRKDAESKKYREKVHEWFYEGFSRRMEYKAPMSVVQSRWHDDDLMGHELSRMNEGSGHDWKVINIPAIAEDGDLLGRVVGEGLWPELFGTEFYHKRKAQMDLKMWNLLYQGNPEGVKV